VLLVRHSVSTAMIHRLLACSETSGMISMPSDRWATYQQLATAMGGDLPGDKPFSGPAVHKEIDDCTDRLSRMADLALTSQDQPHKVLPSCALHLPSNAALLAVRDHRRGGWNLPLWCGRPGVRLRRFIPNSLLHTATD
jgi:hypothetical protein